MSHVLRSRWFGFVMGVLCTLALVAALGSVTGVWAGPLAQDGQSPDEEVIGPAGPDAAVGRVIPIQGRLTDASGNPINGPKNLTYALYTVLSGGTAVCQDNDDVIVTNGLFNGAIDNCGSTALNGQALYLGIKVTGEAAEMTPRQVIRPVPYAFSLVPGAEIGGTNAGDGSLYLKNDAGVTAIGMTASNGLLDVGGSGNEGDIYVRDGTVTNTVTFDVSGDSGLVTLGGPGQDGDLNIKNITDTTTFQVDGNTGDVSQARNADGLVKAAVLANCTNTGASITRSFNRVAGAITIVSGASAGVCTIDFGFDVYDRYVVATVTGDAARSVTYMPGAVSDRLDFYRWTDTGIGVSGNIMVLIY